MRLRRAHLLPRGDLQQARGPWEGIGARQGGQALGSAKPAGSPSGPVQSRQALAGEARERESSSHDVLKSWIHKQFKPQRYPKGSWEEKQKVENGIGEKRKRPQNALLLLRSRSQKLPMPICGRIPATE